MKKEQKQKATRGKTSDVLGKLGSSYIEVTADIEEGEVNRKESDLPLFSTREDISRSF